MERVPPHPTPTSFLPEALGPLAGQHPVEMHQKSRTQISPLICCSGVSIQPGFTARLLGFVPGWDETVLTRGVSLAERRTEMPGRRTSPHLGEMSTWSLGEAG